MLKAVKNKKPVGCVRCKDCAFYDRAKLKSKDDRCVNLGVRELAPVCEDFMPEYHTLSKMDPEVMSTLAHTMRDMSDSEIRMMQYTLSISAKLKRLGYQFGQPCWFWHKDGYKRGYVTGVVVCKTTSESGSKTEPYLVLSSRKVNELTESPSTVYLPVESVFKTKPGV